MCVCVLLLDTQKYGYHKLHTNSSIVCCVFAVSQKMFFFSQQEILEEVVRELHKVKDEIIDGKFAESLMQNHG